MADLAKLVEEKNKQRAALKREFFKQVTNPFVTEKGVIFDPALQRFNSLRVMRIDYFRETPKNTFLAFALVVVPLAATMYLVKRDRDRKESSFRNGEVAYKDRLFKFI